ncbi:Sulfate-transporting ATPase [Thalassoporum mexicanum PCC 7367]|uniref:LPS export ABC transporter ATP-binding protein n=1 Tax=Thalassoporum mexicanum TaxID=3457544 RepID=UPI00029FD8D5|nr:LPS export ABC transporter ATP-binding protein [Pseudanabaena sp. PCC 7367]AFY70820.1 Sulfate-transporting ATPase [Pseudanabaena sp. PCC 7367]
MQLALNDVSKSYGRRTVVKSVNLTVKQGEIVGLLGPNGAGKTTTFYMATGLVQPNRGSVWLDDRDITDLPIHERARLGMAYLAQEPTIFRNLSVRDNLQLVMEQTGVPRYQQKARVNALIKDFQLTHVSGTKGIQISGGERRRTEIARALAIGKEGPKFLLLDEPFAGIDPIAVAEIQSIMADLRDRNMGILITDHNVRETLAIIDRAYIMREGQILAYGDRDQLADNAEVREYYLGKNFRF